MCCRCLLVITYYSCYCCRPARTAQLLAVCPMAQGKDKPTFQPNQDDGDVVVVVNADKVRRHGLLCCCQGDGQLC